MSPGQPGNQNAVGHGAPAGNRNRMKHGLRANLRTDRHGVVLGGLPKGAEYIRDQAGKFQRAIEGDIRAIHGSVGNYQFARCQTAATNRGLAALAQRWLRLESGPDETGKEKMPLADRLACLKAISGLLEASDRGLKDLNLDKTTSIDPWTVYDAQERALAAPGAPSTRNALDAKPEAHTANGPEWQEYPGDHEVSTSGAGPTEEPDQ
jgi:hypothetical protein